ncbi:MAG: hypothetical protein AAGG02_02575 [Cyanobacteria bacterium P01_H01_bin.15]
MIPDDLDRVLKSAFRECSLRLQPLTSEQQQILRDAIAEGLLSGSAVDSPNPLSELAEAERTALCQFVRATAAAGQDWKTQLLNDWLQDRNSGTVQFIRDHYGMSWLNRVQKVHLTEYLDLNDPANGLQLQVGDHIEICNGLWEWVQDTGPCQREWFLCEVIDLDQIDSLEPELQATQTNCYVRFADGSEFEIQGVYQWNRYNWRFPS